MTRTRFTRPRSCLQPRVVRNDFAALDGATEQSEIHRPAERRRSIMLRLARPAAVREMDVRAAVHRFEVERHAGTQPIRARGGELELEGAVRLASIHSRAPVVLGTKAKLEGVVQAR